MNVLHVVVLALCMLAVPLPGQRPKTVDEAVARFEQVRGQAERNRHRAVRDLGRFAEDASTTILVAELSRARTNGYRSTVVLAIGKHKRRGAVGALHDVMTSATNVRLAESAANALRSQGEEG